MKYQFENIQDIFTCKMTFLQYTSNGTAYLVITLYTIYRITRGEIFVSLWNTLHRWSHPQLSVKMQCYKIAVTSPQTTTITP